MPIPNFGPEWVISGADDEAGSRTHNHERLLEAARNAWPDALLYARSVGFTDYEYLASEVWEEVLRSILRTMHRLGSLHHVKDLQAYLIGAFRHRFNRELLKERRYREKFLWGESVEHLENVGKIQNWKPVELLERELQVQETLKLMDPWARRVWNYIKYGYSFKEIAQRLELTEFQVEFRYRRRLARLRQHVRRRGDTAA